MRHDPKTRTVAFLVAFLGSLGGVGVMVTGLRFGEHVPMAPVAVWCLLFALLGALLGGRRGAFVMPLALGLLTVFGWKGLNLDRSLEALLYYTSQLYASGYGWPVIRWSRDPLLWEQAALAFGMLGGWLSVAISLGYLNRGGVWLGAFCTALPLLPCMVLTDTVPQAKWLYLLLLSLLLLLFCSRNPKRGVYLTLPVALLLGLLFLLMPKETYKGQDAAERMWEWLEEKFSREELGTNTEIPVDMPDISHSSVNLSAAGPRPRWMIPVMDVRAQDTGTFYLRSMAFDTYTGTQWMADQDEGEFGFFTTQGQQKILEVETRTVHDTLYLPYGAQSAFSGHLVLEDRVEGRVENTREARSYTVTYSLPDTSELSVRDIYLDSGGVVLGSTMVILGENMYEVQSPLSRYLALPEETRRRAESWLQEYIPGRAVPKWELTQTICQTVSQWASYDLSTDRMPAGEDFALWFLEESETGYCVHFASAAAVLLRAAGIPSRYVEGYVIQTLDGETVTVYQKNAHAWVEVFVDGFGWVMLEPTPGDGVQDSANETTAPPETVTVPQETGPSTETTAPTLPQNQPSQPTHPTAPSETSPIGGADGPNVPEPPKEMPGWVKGLLWTLAAMTALVGQWVLRLSLWKQRRHRGNLNRQVLALWREGALWGRILGRKPPEEFHELALKARFSQYTMSRQERARAGELLEEIRAERKNAPLWRRALAVLLALP